MPELAPNERRHDLDALRAFAMLLGIALHAAMVYLPMAPGAWPVQDANQHAIYGSFVSAVHGFRMPLFFLVSGFFTAMLWRKRGLAALLWHRFRRIFLPLLLGMITIVPAMWWAMSYVKEDRLDPVDPTADVWSAARAGDVGWLRKHLSGGADIDGLDAALKSTPLTTATFTGQTEVVATLLKLGADPNIRNGDDGTVLHAAAFFGRDKIAKLLIDHGADLNIQNRHGETPLDTTVHGWPVVEHIARIVQCVPDQEQVTQGREVVVGLIKNHPDWQPPADEETAGASAAESAGTPAWFRTATEFPLFHHLWFLWFLCILIAAFALYAVIADAVGWQGLPRWLMLTPVCLLWLIPLTIWPQWFMARFGPDTSTVLLPPARILLYYAIFFFFGALYFDSKDTAARIGRGWFVVLPVALLVLFPCGYWLTYSRWPAPFDIVYGRLFSETAIKAEWLRDLLRSAILATYAWLMTFSLMGLFHWMLRRENPTVRYFSDASYWLYLTHLPTLFFIQFWLKPLPLPAFVKFVLACLVCTGFLLVLYQYLVRYTWIGWLLNGRKARPGGANSTERTATGLEVADEGSVVRAEA